MRPWPTAVLGEIRPEPYLVARDCRATPLWGDALYVVQIVPVILR